LFLVVVVFVVVVVVDVVVVVVVVVVFTVVTVDLVVIIVVVVVVVVDVVVVVVVVVHPYFISGSLLELSLSSTWKAGMKDSKDIKCRERRTVRNIVSLDLHSFFFNSYILQLGLGLGLGLQTF
jgi:hypothetical protein